jgi:predicted DNA-binding protein
MTTNITGTEYVFNFRMPTGLKRRIERLSKERKESFEAYIIRSLALITQYKETK